MNCPVTEFFVKAVALVEVWHGDIIWIVKVGYGISSKDGEEGQGL